MCDEEVVKFLSLQLESLSVSFKWRTQPCGDPEQLADRASFTPLSSHPGQHHPSAPRQAGTRAGTRALEPSKIELRLTLSIHNSEVLASCNLSNTNGTKRSRSHLNMLLLKTNNLLTFYTHGKPCVPQPVHSLSVIPAVFLKHEQRVRSKCTKRSTPTP